MSDNELARGEREDGASIMEKLAFRRFIRGITVKEVARIIGVDQQVLSNYERGKSKTPFFVVEKICNLFGYRLIILDKKGKKIYENRRTE